MPSLWLYHRLSRFDRLSYRAKIMVMAFAGTHVPLIALVAYVALRDTASWSAFLETLVVALVATLAGTGATMLVLDHLLRPVLLTAQTLRRYRETRDVGALPVHYRDEVGTLMADAGITLDHLERALVRLELLDTATGLFNRTQLVCDLAQRAAAGTPFRLCGIRFETYRVICETMDLASAEDAAVEIAARLPHAFPRAMLYRVTPSDFALIRDGDAELSAEAFGAGLKGALADGRGTLSVGTLDLDPVLLAGVAAFPADAADPEALIDEALGAIAHATADSPVTFHSPQARRAVLDRLQLEHELRRALARDEFVLHYQPVVDVARGRAVGAEALIRWQHPEHGLLAPARFIPEAEASGLIDPIGLWVLREACGQARRWNEAGLSGLKMAVNLSARQFLDPRLLGHVADTLAEARIDPDQLEIELTETAAMADADHTRQVFGQLRDLGVSIAIDDFGSGYAGMSYLRKLPFDKLKIDREFVTDVHRTGENQAICDALIALARGLKLRVLAEGAETEEEVRFLEGRGCTLFQGYWFSRPVSADRFADGLTQLDLSAKSRAVRGPVIPGAREPLRRIG